ncbi:MAG: NAD/NADP octopine/nopaline dehydrogenase family protein [Pikeienuella sp.]
MKIAVLGGGNGSAAAVVDATEAGHKTRWWRRSMENFGSVATTKTMTVIDHAGSREVPVSPTDNLAQAINGAELILIPTPAFAQEDIAKALAPHLVDGQVLYLPPGSFGAYVMMRIIRDAGCTAQIAIAETGTLPWLCRKQGEDTVRITTRASRLPTGVLPTSKSAHALSIIEQAFPGAIEDCGDILSAALMNAGPIIHSPLIVMNAGPIEHFDRWDIHNEGTQPSVRMVHIALDSERMAVREKLGYGAPHFPLDDHYNTSNWMYGNLAHDKLVDSGDWHEKLNLSTHRYMSEDMAVGLAFLVSVGEWLGMEMPVSKGLLAIGSVTSGRDLRADGRTMENLGLAEITVSAVQAMLAEGFS